MLKAQAEIDQLLGKGWSRSGQEYDIPKLPYIQAIVKDVLRLHPLASFFVPHMVETSAEVCGYYVPKNA